MILLLDVGNSRLKWGAWEAGQWADRGAMPLGEIEQLSHRLRHRPAWVGVCCVAGASIEARLEAVIRRWEAPAHWLRPRREGHGLVNRYADPERLGVDRYAALIGASRLGLAPCVVVSAGTALTIDALAGEGEFLGGMILPGVELMRAALRQGTAGVAEVAGDVVDFPRRTADAVESGIAAAMVGAVEAMRERLSRRAGQSATVVMTGGNAEWLAPLLPPHARVFETLILEGMRWVARDMNAPGD